MVPPVDGEPWPSLGGQVAEFMEAYLVHGPGDLLGQPYRLDREKRALLRRIYEVYPRGHPQAGRRRFRRVALSVRKGWAKTEFAAAIAACELHPAAPVRCVGFDRQGQPVGAGVTDPYIPLVAYTEEQSDELAYSALKAMLERGPLADDFDLGLTRIMRRGGDGRAVSLATAPDARDGARTTFEVFDETHRLVLPRQKTAHRTMLANLPKRRGADAWALEITTAYSPGQNSVAEDTMRYAEQVAEGGKSDSRLFFFHRQASDGHDLTTPEGVRAAVLEASGPAAEWSDIDGICEQFEDPTADRSYLERVWLNRPTRGSSRAFDVDAWRALAVQRSLPADGAHITLGFDGSRTRDSTGLVATEIVSGYQWVVGHWERPAEMRPDEPWEVPAEQVDQAVEAAMERWNVWRLYCDPPYWETKVGEWAGRWGDKCVMEWWTNRQRAMAYALRGFANAIANGEITHSGDLRLTRHIGNAVRRDLVIVDDEQRPLWLIQKERPDSLNKIDLAMAAVLSWEARTDALAAGMAQSTESVYERRGLLDLWDDEEDGEDGEEEPAGE
jgi:phage terminase large subunit-like protein